MSVLDASAILAFLQDEQGSDLVEQVLVDGATCGAPNWSEVVQKVTGAGRNWGLVSALLDSYDIEVVPFGRDDAEAAASMWRQGSGLSLADRGCLALADRLDTDVITADRAWGTSERIRQIR